jgi:hypothetical protein
VGRVDHVTLCIPLHHISFGFSKISDILTKSLLNEALEWDFKDNGNKPPKDRNSKHLSDVVECIQECGVSFNVWEKRNADGKGSGVHDFTSLMGSETHRNG